MMIIYQMCELYTAQEHYETYIMKLFFQREKDAKVIVNKYISKYIMVTLEINSLKFSLIRGTN